MQIAEANRFSNPAHPISTVFVMYLYKHLSTHARGAVQPRELSIARLYIYRYIIIHTSGRRAGQTSRPTYIRAGRRRVALFGLAVQLIMNGKYPAPRGSAGYIRIENDFRDKGIFFPTYKFRRRCTIVRAFTYIHPSVYLYV